MEEAKVEESSTNQTISAKINAGLHEETKSEQPASTTNDRALIQEESKEPVPEQ